MKKKIAIFISGRGSNMEAIINNTQNGNLSDCCEIAVVLSDKIDAPGLCIAQGYHIPTLTIPSSRRNRQDFEEEVIRKLAPYQVDYIVLAGFMRILSKTLLSEYRNRIINIHPADTREFKGLHAYEWAFETNRESTKITVHYVDEGVDSGKIIDQREVDLRGVRTLEEVLQRGLRVEHQFYSEVLEKLLKGNLGVN